MRHRQDDEPAGRHIAQISGARADGEQARRLARQADAEQGAVSDDLD
jgi:hypothetical protein